LASETPDPPQDAAAPRPTETLQAALRPLPYQRDIVAHLKRHEAEQWSWFSSTRFLDEYAQGVGLDLLNATPFITRSAPKKPKRDPDGRSWT
jgi:hypothetical protein